MVMEVAVALDGRLVHLSGPPVLVNEFHVFGLWYDTSWPLLIVWAGVRIMLCATENAGRGPGQRIQES